MEKKTKGRTETPGALYPGMRLPLDPPREAGVMTLEETLARRRSVREYSDKAITKAEASQLLWAAQGVTGTGGLRAAPSAGAVFPLRAYLLAGAVEELPSGVYGFDPDSHEIEFLIKGDRRSRLYDITGGQVPAAESAIAVLLTAWYTRMQREFGALAPTLAHIEAGHAGQNFLLQAVALGLSAMGIGKFDRDQMSRLCHLPSSEEPLYLLLAGHSV